MMTWNGSFFHSPASPMSLLIVTMHDYAMVFMFSVLLLVLLVLMFSALSGKFCFKFFVKHQLESVWTILPFFILFVVLLPSIFSLYMLESCSFCGLTVNITGHQWYWSYDYKKFEGVNFDSYMLPSENTNLRLLETDNRLILPTIMPIRFLVSSADVIHSWTLPSFGVKMDAIPGRINQFCTSALRSGIFFGQCSEICGANHSFMPIMVETIPSSNFYKLFLLSNLCKVFIF